MFEELSETYVEIALDQRLRTHTGAAFQRFFSDIMSKLDDDFIRVKPQGRLGDEGIDGCFLSGTTVHQCYGADNGHVTNAKQAARKIVRDFETVRALHPEVRRWVFTHNLVDGLPVEFVKALREVQALGAPSEVEVGQYGSQQFLRDIRRLEAHEKARLLGTDAFHADRLDRLPHAIDDIVTSIMATVHSSGFRLSEDPRPVPVEKFELNNIPMFWKDWLVLGLVHAPTAWQCISTHGSPEAADVVPEFFKTRYMELKLSGDTPAQILHELHTLVVGGVRSLDTDGMRGFAGYVLLATMFESCQIFEDKQVSVLLELPHDPAN